MAEVSVFTASTDVCEAASLAESYADVKLNPVLSVIVLGDVAHTSDAASVDRELTVASNLPDSVTILTGIIATPSVEDFPASVMVFAAISSAVNVILYTPGQLVESTSEGELVGMLAVPSFITLRVKLPESPVFPTLLAVSHARNWTTIDCDFNAIFIPQIALRMLLHNNGCGDDLIGKSTLDL